MTARADMVELYLLSDAYDFGQRTPLWGIDGRPARVGVRFAHCVDGVLLSVQAIHDPVWKGRALERLRRGEFGGISESEALRLRLDRAAAARLTHARFSIAAHRYHRTLGLFVGSHAPCTHYLGSLLEDPYCVTCGLGDEPDPGSPLYPCGVLRVLVDSHPLVVPGG